MSYNLQGAIYIKDEDYKKATDQLKAAERIYEGLTALKDSYLEDFAHCRTNLAQVCMKTGDIDGAIDYYVNVYELLKEAASVNKHKYYYLLSITVNDIGVTQSH